MSHIFRITKSATISRNGSGKYFISLLCETDIQELPKTNSSVGIDLVINDFAILSTVEKIENLIFRKQLEDKLKREQRKLSKRLLIAKKENRKLSEAKNYQKQRIGKNERIPDQDQEEYRIIQFNTPLSKIQSGNNKSFHSCESSSSHLWNNLFNDFIP